MHAVKQYALFATLEPQLKPMFPSIFSSVFDHPYFTSETPTPPMEPKLTPVSPVSEEVAAIGGIEQGIPRAARERAMGEVVAMEKQEGRSIGGGSQGEM